MKNTRKYIILLLLLAFVGFLGYKYLYQEHRNIQSETSKVEISAVDLLQKFQREPNPNLLNNTITVSGIITEIESHSITLDGSVNCAFNVETSNLKINDKVSIKGRCIGYDDLFEVVKIDQSSILKDKS